MTDTMDTSFVLGPAEQTAAVLRDLKEKIDAASDTEGNLKADIESKIAASVDSDLPEKVISTINAQTSSDLEVAALWIAVQRAVEAEFGRKVKEFVKAQVEKAKAEKPDSVKASDSEIAALRDQYSKQYNMWKALKELGKVSGLDLDAMFPGPNGKAFEGIRGAIPGGGKRMSKELIYSINGENLPADKCTAGNAAKLVGVPLKDFVTAYTKEAGVTLGQVGDADKLPADVSFKLNDKNVRVYKKEVDDDDEIIEDENDESVADSSE